MYWCCAQIEPCRERLAWRGIASRWQVIGSISRCCASTVAVTAEKSSSRRRCLRLICSFGWFTAGGMRDGLQAYVGS